MTAVLSRKSKPAPDQMCFSFLAAQEHPRKKPLKRLPRKRKKTIIDPDTPVTASASPFEDLCLLLHRIAAKHVSRADFADIGAVIRCTQLLKELGLNVSTPAELQAPVSMQDNALVTHAPQYRFLRSRAIAGLATVADLAFKAPAKGSTDYQRGQRDAFQFASAIAADFLNDFSDENKTLDIKLQG